MPVSPAASACLLDLVLIIECVIWIVVYSLDDALLPDYIRESEDSNTNYIAQPGGCALSKVKVLEVVDRNEIICVPCVESVSGPT